MNINDLRTKVSQYFFNVLVIYKGATPCDSNICCTHPKEEMTFVYIGYTNTGSGKQKITRVDCLSSEEIDLSKHQLEDLLDQQCIISHRHRCGDEYHREVYEVRLDSCGNREAILLPKTEFESGLLPCPMDKNI